MASMTTGVAIPSLRPLSTVISRRIREGTAGLVTTGMPSAASVGASAAATSSASHTPSPGNSHTASSQPARMVSGRPTPSSRTYCPMPWRKSWNRIRAASENSTHTKVISTSGFRAAGAEGASTRPRTASSAPPA